MDGSHFDVLTQQFAATVTRRTTLGGVVAGLAGLIGLSRTDSAAQPEAAAKPCLQNGTRCHRHSGGPGDPCRRCCSGHSKPRTGVKGRRCACVPGGKRCRQSTQCCGGRRCVDGRCAPPAPRCGSGGPCRVFITSAGYLGDLREQGQGRGIAGADAKCQRVAAAAGLSGTYMAWLSDALDSPATRFPLHSPGPYVLVDGTEVAASWDDLTDGGLAAPINRSEFGGEIGGLVWTNTTPAGLPISPDAITGTCGNWDGGGSTGWAGNSGRVNAGWTDDRAFGCASLAHLYCFQQS